MRVLLVEDNQLTATSLEHLLVGEGMTVCCVSSASSALDVLVTSGFLADVALIDVRLGDGDSGISLLEQLRSWGGGKTLPVILMTAGELSGEDLKRAGVCGVIRVLSKPFEFDELLRLVKTSVP